MKREQNRKGKVVVLTGFVVCIAFGLRVWCVCVKIYIGGGGSGILGCINITTLHVCSSCWLTIEGFLLL